VPSEFAVSEVLSGEVPAEKADTFSFASIPLLIVMNSPFGQTDQQTIAGHPITESVPEFVASIEKLESGDFRIAEEVNLEELWAFVSLVKLPDL
jgi:hypothetical protein